MTVDIETGEPGEVVGLEQLSAALRDAAVYFASIERRPWRVGWQEAAKQIDVVVTAPNDLDGASVSCSFTSLGVMHEVAVEWPPEPAEVMSKVVGMIGDVAAEYWRVPLPRCDAERDGERCELGQGHGGRHRVRRSDGSTRWGDRT